MRRNGGEAKRCEVFVVSEANYAENAEFLDALRLCDEQYVSTELEGMTYDVLQYPDNMGFFCRNPASRTVASVVCIEFQERGKVVEVTLVCSSEQNRVRGASRELFAGVLNYVRGEGVEQVYLHVAKGAENKRAVAFYTSLQFTQEGNGDIMTLAL
jgi:GNAT superfamily N-acetyltransferase